MQPDLKELSPRRRVALPLFVIASRLVELEHRQYDLLYAIAEAEERGDWPLAAQLRSRQDAKRRASDRASHGSADSRVPARRGEGRP